MQQAGAGSGTGGPLLAPAQHLCAPPPALGPPPPNPSQVSAQLFTAHRQYHEGQLTKRKELVVANIALAEAAMKVRRQMGAAGRALQRIEGGGVVCRHCGPRVVSRTSPPSSPCAPSGPLPLISLNTAAGPGPPPARAVLLHAQLGLSCRCQGASARGVHAAGGWDAGCSVANGCQRQCPGLHCVRLSPSSCPNLCLLCEQKTSKVLADAMEALLGAFLAAGGYGAALAFLQVEWVGELWGEEGAVPALCPAIAAPCSLTSRLRHCSTWACCATGSRPPQRPASSPRAMQERRVMWQRWSACWGEVGGRKGRAKGTGVHGN